MKLEKIRPTEILLSGELTIRYAAEIRDALTVLIGEMSPVKVRIETAAEVDPAFLQLLCSAHRTANRMGKCLTLDTGDGAKIREQLEEAGFVRHIGCLLDCNNNCIWAAPAPV